MVPAVIPVIPEINQVVSADFPVCRVSAAQVASTLHKNGEQQSGYGVSGGMNATEREGKGRYVQSVRATSGNMNKQKTRENLRNIYVMHKYVHT
jgi:hypothetical protein